MPLSVPADDDEALYSRFIAGDNEACVILFRRHNQRLFTYCVKLVGDTAQAQDITQEVWGRMIEMRGTGRSLENPIGFLMRMARNLCLDHLKVRNRLLSIDSLHESAHPVYSMRELSEAEEHVVWALQQLAIDYREVLILNTYCGYSFEDIAGILGKTPEAIWTRASRARSQLRKLIHAARDGQPPLSFRDTKIGGQDK